MYTFPPALFQSESLPGTVKSLTWMNDATDFSIVDQVATAYPWVRSGDAIVTNAQYPPISNTTRSMFPDQVSNPTASLRGYSGFDMNGLASLIQTATAFSVEAWVYITQPLGYNNYSHAILGQCKSLGGGEQGLCIYNQKLHWVRNPGVTSGALNYVGNITIPLNTWTFVEFGWDDGTGYTFVNGALDGTFSDATGWFNTGQLYTLGHLLNAGFDAYRFGLVGYLGGVRIISGGLRHKLPYSVPTAPLSRY